MIVLYALGLALLGVATFITGRRARNLERKYVAAAKDAERLSHDLTMRGGNRGQVDPCASARKTYELGRLVQKRDQLEAKYTNWETRSERLARTRKGLRQWKGRLAPYALGAIDAALVIAGLAYIGAVQIDPREVIEKVRAVVLR